MLDEKDFLPETEFSQLRKELYELFEKVFTYVKNIDTNIDVIAVNCGNAVCANNNRITIPINPDDKGAIFHEVGHLLFAGSVFHSDYNKVNKGGNEEWGEAFAEAIRWLREREHIKASEWLDDFNKYKNDTKTDKGKAERILDKSSHSLDGFRQLWLDLVQDYDDSRDYLDKKLLN